MTAPLTAWPPSCVVTVDGVRLADGRPGDAANAPTALSGLRVSWGRASTVDQPSPATLTLDVLDAAGGQTYLEALGLGRRVVVTAAAVLYGAPTVPTFTDGGFEALPVGPLPPARGTAAGAAAAVTAAAAHAGGRGVRLTPATPAGYVTVTFPPAAYGPPTAWDALPRTVIGQRWAYSAWVRAALWLGWSSGPLRIRPVEYTGPTAEQGRPVADAAVEVASAGAWAQAAGDYLPTPGRWVGVELGWPSTPRPAWSDLGVAPAWADLGVAPAWADLAVVDVDDVAVTSPPAGAERAGAVFSGRITDLAARYSVAAGGSVVTVTAQDDVAELDNRYVGDTPWPVESVAARFARVVAASGQALTYTVDAGVAGRLVSARDVDRRGAAELLESLARTVGGVLWAATSTAAGAFLRLEDVDARPALLKLVYDAGVALVVIVPGPAAANGITLDACVPELTPLVWEQTTADDATRVGVTWLDQTTAPPTSRTVEVLNAGAEAATGQRRVTASSELTTAGDANVLAGALLGRLSVPGWRLAGLSWSVPDDPLDNAALDRVMRILDGATRLGLPVLLTGLPGWTPIAPRDELPLYLEGGRFTYEQGAWRVELVTSSARAQGAAAAAWNALPGAWRWVDFDPSIRWSDLAGVTV